MVEIEQLNPFRFYKLIPHWKQRCEREYPNKCNGYLWMYRNKGNIKLRCNHVDCLQEYEIPRYCNNCEAIYTFDSTTCDNCEPLVIQAAQYYITVEESDKAIKKINKHYKANQMSQEDWEAAIQLNKQEKISCENKLKELKERNPIIERHLATLIKQQ